MIKMPCKLVELQEGAAGEGEGRQAGWRRGDHRAEARADLMGLIFQLDAR